MLAQMERILSDPSFEANARRKAMFRYLVEEAVAGRGELLKGFTVATAVFGRDDSFDPQSDPIVRIEARRLRSDLDAYYAGKGHSDRLRIVIPKGGYLPLAYWQNDLPQTEPALARPSGAGQPAEPETEIEVGPSVRVQPKNRAVTLMLLGSALLLSAVAVFGLWQWQRPATNVAVQQTSVPVMVLPFDALGASDEETALSVGLTQELIADLMQFSGLRLYTANASFRQDPNADAAALGKDLGVTYVVRGSVATEGDGLQVITDLEDATSGRVLWSKSSYITLTPGELIATRAKIAGDIARQLGQTYGVIKTDVARSVAAQQSGELRSYLCVLRAHEYRRTFDTALYPTTLDCLENATAEDPAFAEAWAMLAFLRLDAARYSLVAQDAKAQKMRDAATAASRALKLDPENLSGLQALAAIDYYGGDFDASEDLMRKAVELHPNDPDTLVQFGWRLAARGKWDEGIPLVEKGIARTMNPPGWYYHAIAVHDYVLGDYAGAVDAAERSAVNGSGVGLAVVAAAEAQRGDLQAAKAALQQLAEADPEMFSDPAKGFQLHQVIAPTVAALTEGLKKAGWVAP